MRQLSIEEVDEIIVECEDTLVELYKLRDQGKKVDSTIEHVQERLKKACNLMCLLQGLSR
jgi:methionyl-tRNA formyltransferase